MMAIIKVRLRDWRYVSKKQKLEFLSDSIIQSVWGGRWVKYGCIPT